MCPSSFVIYWTFRAMVGAGFLMLVLAAWALYAGTAQPRGRSGRCCSSALPFAIALPYLANSTGWILTEMGRQPWIVFGLLRTEQGVSATVSGGLVLASLIGFTLVYGVLMVADVYLLVEVRAGRHGTDRERRRAHDDPGRRRI